MEVILSEVLCELNPRNCFGATEIDCLFGHLIPAGSQSQYTFDHIIAMNNCSPKRMKQLSFMIARSASGQVASELVISREYI